jgi:hypothetical protein
VEIIAKVDRVDTTMADNTDRSGNAREDGYGALVVDAVAVDPERIHPMWRSDETSPTGQASRAVGTEVPDDIDSVNLTLRIKGAEPSEYPVGTKLRITVEKVD